MELDKDLVERFRSKFGLVDLDQTEWLTDAGRIVGLPKPDQFDKSSFLYLGRFRLKINIKRRKERTIGIFLGEGVKSTLLFGAMTVVRRRKILELGLYRDHILTVSNGERIVCIAPIRSESIFDENLSELIDERDIEKYRETLLWFKMLKGGE